MSSRPGINVCLCLEDLGSCLCGILINELGSGRLFGCDQTLKLKVQHSDENDKLEDLLLEIQDCAFPVIKELSCHQTLSDLEPIPDVILVLLSARNFPYKMGTPTIEQFQRLLSLVIYISNLSNMLSMLELDTVKIIIAGDLALTAASVMSRKLSKLSANQLIAIDLHQRNKSKVTVTGGCYRTAKGVCETVKQWWSGVQTSALTYLGVKHTDPAQRASTIPGSGYFFSTSVNLTGPTKFVTSSDLHIDHDHIAEVKVINDHAFRILQEVNEQFNESGKDISPVIIAHL